jgi:hypothetical protein
VKKTGKQSGLRGADKTFNQHETEVFDIDSFDIDSFDIDSF